MAADITFLAMVSASVSPSVRVSQCQTLLTRIILKSERWIFKTNFIPLIRFGTELNASDFELYVSKFKVKVRWKPHFDGGGI